MSDATQDQGASARARRGRAPAAPDAATTTNQPPVEDAATVVAGIDLGGTVDEILEQVGTSSGRAASVSNAEVLRRGDAARTELLDRLAEIVTAVPSAPAAPRERAFPRERLLGPDGPRIVGHEHHVIVGALEGVPGDEFTRDAAAQLVEAWLTKPAETTPAKPEEA